MSSDDGPRGPIPDSYWLIPGALLAGEYPGTYVEEDTREKLAKFLDAGLRTFINLTEERELSGYEHILQALSAERGHCWGGIGRTGTVVGCWLVEQGLSGDEALHRIAELRRGTPDGRIRSPESDEQCRYVREWLESK